MAPVRTRTLSIIYLLFVHSVLRVRCFRCLHLGPNAVTFFQINTCHRPCTSDVFDWLRDSRGLTLFSTIACSAKVVAPVFSLLSTNRFFRSKYTASYVFFFFYHRANVNCARSVGRYDCGSCLALVTTVVRAQITNLKRTTSSRTVSCCTRSAVTCRLYTKWEVRESYG